MRQFAHRIVCLILLDVNKTNGLCLAPVLLSIISFHIKLQEEMKTADARSHCNVEGNLRKRKDETGSGTFMKLRTKRRLSMLLPTLWRTVMDRL
jgi:hypothetical protein